MRGLVIDLKSGVGSGSGKPHHVVRSVVDLGRDVPDRDVLGAEVVIDKDLASDLKRKRRLMDLLRV